MKTPFPPMVVHGTISTNSGRTQLSFLRIDDPVNGIIPMTNKAYVARFNHLFESDSRWGWWGWDRFNASRAARESRKLYKIYSKLAMTEGLDQLWATRASLIVEGDPVHFGAISSKIRSVMTEVLGEIRFEEVPHGEAAPLFFDFKKSA
jgi:hypothetical protein